MVIDKCSQKGKKKERKKKNLLDADTFIKNSEEKERKDECEQTNERKKKGKKIKKTSSLMQKKAS